MQVELKDILKGNNRPVFISDEDVERVPVQPRQEAVVSIKDHAPHVILNDDPWLIPCARLEVVERLNLASIYLVEELEKGPFRHIADHCKIKVFDAARTIEMQRKYYNHFYKKARQRWPEKTRAELQAEVDQWVARPNKNSPSGHISGSSLDVRIVLQSYLDSNKTHVFSMIKGALIPDKEDKNHFPGQHSSVAVTTAEKLDPLVVELRRALVTAMHRAGFENYYNEWWHFDFGNQRYVAAQQARRHACLTTEAKFTDCLAAACYAPVTEAELPPNARKISEDLKPSMRFPDPFPQTPHLVPA